MGFFSWECKGCDHPLLSEYAVNSINAWMMRCVVVTEDGAILKGSYDGYGRLVTPSDELDFVTNYDTFTAWHEACWLAAGSPSHYQGPSKYADDQGYFFDEGAHDMPEPKAAAKEGWVVTHFTETDTVDGQYETEDAAILSVIETMRNMAWTVVFDTPHSGSFYEHTGEPAAEFVIRAS